jgi:hypothetical protein
MHRALGILDIIELICAHVQAHGAGSAERDFAALARTCKDFQEPALDRLWREQRTITNILTCLPPNLWEETTRERLLWLARTVVSHLVQGLRLAHR